ncbi:MAG: helical backbone metal receptor [bacterium]|nr:helical backbone metal receptor [bacterium]
MKNFDSIKGILTLKICFFAVLALLYGVLCLEPLYVNSAIHAENNSPQRIISLVPVLTEELYLLGVENRLIANTSYCKRPPAAEKKEKIGSGMKISVEKILYLEPDLILAKWYSNQKQIEKLRNLGMEVKIFPDVKNFSGICEELIELSKTIGSEDKSKQIVRRAKNKVSSIQRKIKDLSKPKVLVQIGAKPLWVATKDSFINDFIKLAGGINIGPSGKSGLYSREKVLEQNPDVIIIVTMGIVGEQEKETWQKYKTLNAAKNNRIHIVDSYKVCSPTPVSFVEVLEEIVEILH